MSKKHPSLWTFFKSLRLTIALLAVISILSIAGTLIPQQEAAVEFARKLQPGTAKVLHTLQLFDIYHSFWFLSILALLSLNLIVCSLSRFPAAWRQYRRTGPPAPGTADFTDLSPDRSLATPEKPADAALRLEKLLKRRYGTVHREDGPEGVVLHAERGRFSYMGVYIVHLSILVIIAGMIIGSFFGFDARVNIEEGETIQAVELRGGKGIRKLDFGVRCNRFTLEFYENGMPKTYRSDLTILKDGRSALEAILQVNHPLAFEGIRFYQASYGPSPDGKAVLSYGREKGKGRQIRIAAGETFDIPEARAKVEVLRIEENMMEMGPAVKILIRAPGKDLQIWLFKHIDQIREANPGIVEKVALFNPGIFSPYIFSLDQLEQKYYTGLQVTNDPGAPLVAGGGFLMVLGLMVVFLVYHRRIWICVDAPKGKTRIRAGGRSNRNPAGLEREIRSILSSRTQEPHS